MTASAAEPLQRSSAPDRDGPRGRLAEVSVRSTRALALAGATLALTWGVTGVTGAVAAMVGSTVGMIAGERLGRSHVRIALVLVGLLALCAALFALAAAAVRTEVLASIVGVGAALSAAASLRLGALSLAVVAALRSVAVRWRAAVTLELAFVATAVASVFASHRDGIIVRPLWLSDWAWQRGIDPAEILLLAGGASVVVLAVLLVIEMRTRRALSALAFLAGLALLGVVALNTFHPTPQPALSLGLAGGGGSPPSESDGGAGPQGGGGASQGDASVDGGGGGSSSRPRPPDEMFDDESPSSSSPAPMAVVLLDDDYTPPSQTLYFRQDAWSQFNGVRLVRATRAGVDGDTFDEFPVSPVRAADPPPLAGRASVDATVALLVEHARPFALESPARLAPAPNPNPARFLRAYRTTSLAQSAAYRDLLGRRSGDRRWPPEVRAHYLAGPSDARYAALAGRITEGVADRFREDPFALALAVKRWLDHELIYSTRHRHAGVPDPTAHFLFGDRTGYCVHFAHAAVYLWRSLGIASRIGIGYAVADGDRHGGSSVLVRSADAHAWPELYIDGAGWIVLDIAAERNLDAPLPPPDDELRRLLGEMARRVPSGPGGTGAPRPGAGLRSLLAQAALAIAVVLLVLLYTLKVWRRLIPWLAPPDSLPRLGYRTALDMLAEAGIEREPGETRERFASRTHAIAPTFSELTAMHLSARLGDPAAPRAGRREWSRRAWLAGLRALAVELARATPAWRRLSGLLHPASFLDAR